jgi:hypothetical protein
MMQKAVILMESIVVLLMMGIALWERNKRTIKGWWKAWRAKLKQERHLRARTPEDCQECRWQRWSRWRDGHKHGSHGGRSRAGEGDRRRMIVMGKRV